MQRFLRRDDPATRPAFTHLARFNLAKSDLVPLLTRYADDEDLVTHAREFFLSSFLPFPSIFKLRSPPNSIHAHTLLPPLSQFHAVKVATFLTMPVAPDSDRQLAQAEAAAAVAAAFLAPGALPVAVSLLAEPLSRHPSMGEEDARTVQLVLTFLRNLVAAPAAVLRRLRGGGGGPVGVIPPGPSGVGAGKAPRGAPAPASADGGCAPPLGSGGAADMAARLRTRLVGALAAADVPELLLLLAQRAGEGGAGGRSAHPLRTEAPLLLDTLDALLEGVGADALWEGALTSAAAAAAKEERALLPQKSDQPRPPRLDPAARRSAALAADPAAARLLAAVADRDRAARHRMYREGPLRGPRWGAVFVRRLDASTDVPLAGNPRAAGCGPGGGGGGGGGCSSRASGRSTSRAFAPGGRARLTSAPTAQAPGGAGLLGGDAHAALGAYALSFLDRGGWAGLAAALARDLSDGPLVSRLTRDDFERYARTAAKLVGLARLRCEARTRLVRGEAGAPPLPPSCEGPASSPFAGVALSLGWDSLALARGLWATAAATAAAAPDKDWALQHAAAAWLKEMLLALDAAAAGAGGRDDAGAASRLVRRLLFDGGNDDGDGERRGGGGDGSNSQGGGLVALLASGAARFNPRFQPRSHAADLAAAIHVALRLHDRLAAEDSGAHVSGGGGGSKPQRVEAEEAEAEVEVVVVDDDGERPWTEAAPAVASPSPAPPVPMDLSPSPSPRRPSSPTPLPVTASAEGVAAAAGVTNPKTTGGGTATPGPPRAAREAAPPPDTIHPPRVMGPVAVPPPPQAPAATAEEEEGVGEVGAEAGTPEPSAAAAASPAAAAPPAESPVSRRARASQAGAAAASARVRAHLTSPPVVHFYFWLLAGYKTNPPALNRAVAAFLRRVRSAPPAGCDLAPMLWQLRGLAVMRDVLCDTAWRAGGGGGSAARTLAAECAATARGLFARLLPPAPRAAAKKPAAKPTTDGHTFSSDDGDGACGEEGAADAAARAVATAREGAAGGACASLLSVELLFWKPPASAAAIRDQYDWRRAYGGEGGKGDGCLSPRSAAAAAASAKGGAAARALEDPNLPDEAPDDIDGPQAARLAVLAEEARAAWAASAGALAGYAPAADPAFLERAGAELGVPAGAVRRQCRLLGVGGGAAAARRAGGPAPGDAARLAALFHQHAGKRAALDLIADGMAAAGGPASWWTRPRVSRALAAAGLRRGVMGEAHLASLTALHAEYGASPGGLDSMAAQLPGGWRTGQVARALKRAGLALAGAALAGAAGGGRRKKQGGGGRAAKKARHGLGGAADPAAGSGSSVTSSEGGDASFGSDGEEEADEGGHGQAPSALPPAAVRVAMSPPTAPAPEAIDEEDEAAHRARAAAAVKSALAALRAKRAAAVAEEDPPSEDEDEEEAAGCGGADENAPPAAAPAALEEEQHAAPPAAAAAPPARKRLRKRLGNMGVESRVVALAFSSDDEA